MQNSRASDRSNRISKSKDNMFLLNKIVDHGDRISVRRCPFPFVLNTDTAWNNNVCVLFCYCRRLSIVEFTGRL